MQITNLPVRRHHTTFKPAPVAQGPVPAQTTWSGTPQVTALLPRPAVMPSPSEALLAYRTRPAGYALSAAPAGARTQLENLHQTAQKGLPAGVYSAAQPYQSFVLANLAAGGAPGFLGSGAITVEDKITLMLMTIMKRMDRDLIAQGENLARLQSTSPVKNGTAGASTVARPTSNTAPPSVDVETMRLKRMVDKRSQMFDLLRSIVDKYNQTAQGVIRSINR